MLGFIVLTGATGFVGRYLLRELMRRGYRLTALLRQPMDLPPGVDSHIVGDLRQSHDLESAVAGADAVVHAAALTATAGARIRASEADYHTVNVGATLRLARAAMCVGVGRFVYLSSISAQSGPMSRQVLTEDLSPQPITAYGRSKLAAEQGLSALDLDWVALRPIPVYGPGMTGQMASLIDLARSPAPLPFGRFTAKRSLLSLQNLAEALDTVLTTSQPLRRPFIVAEPEPLTLPEMIKALRQGLGRRPGLIHVPLELVEAVCRATGRYESYQRFQEPFIANPQALLNLGWHPAVKPQEWLQVLAQEGMMKARHPA